MDKSFWINLLIWSLLVQWIHTIGLPLGSSGIKIVLGDNHILLASVQFSVRKLKYLELWPKDFTNFCNLADHGEDRGLNSGLLEWSSWGQNFVNRNYAGAALLCSVSKIGLRWSDDSEIITFRDLFSNNTFNVDFKFWRTI